MFCYEINEVSIKAERHWVCTFTRETIGHHIRKKHGIFTNFFWSMISSGLHYDLTPVRPDNNRKNLIWSLLWNGLAEGCASGSEISNTGMHSLYGWHRYACFSINLFFGEGNWILKITPHSKNSNHKSRTTLNMREISSHETLCLKMRFFTNLPSGRGSQAYSDQQAWISLSPSSFL